MLIGPSTNRLTIAAIRSNVTSMPVASEAPAQTPITCPWFRSSAYDCFIVLSLKNGPEAAGRSDELNGRADGGGDEQAGGDERAEQRDGDALKAGEVEGHCLAP